ncbi:unnamed protein product [Penicillium nalgiovense]|nr:unnamed protein product [Penicillium nalgiovense]
MSLLSRHASTHFLAPLVIFPWGPLAMSYLGVPIVVGVSDCYGRCS